MITIEDFNCFVTDAIADNGPNIFDDEDPCEFNPDGLADLARMVRSLEPDAAATLLVAVRRVSDEHEIVATSVIEILMDVDEDRAIVSIDGEGVEKWADKLWHNKELEGLY